VTIKVNEKLGKQIMPSKSKAQEKLMQAAAHNPKFAKKVKIPVEVAQEFVKTDKAKRKK
jgi:hypothetical protein